MADKNNIMPLGQAELDKLALDLLAAVGSNALHYANVVNAKELDMLFYLAAIIEDKYIKDKMISYNEKGYYKLCSDIVKDFGDSNLIPKKLKSEAVKIKDSDVELLTGLFTACNMANYDVILKNPNFLKIHILATFLICPDTEPYKVLMQNGFNLDFIADMYNNEASGIIFNERIQPNLTDDMASLVDSLTENVNKLLDEEVKISNPKKSVKKNENVSPAEQRALARENAFLEAFTVNVNQVVSSKDWIPIVGREEEIKTVEQVLLRKDTPNAILIGHDGVGKNKILEGLVKKSIDKKENITFYKLDIVSLMANAGIKGELESRLKNLTDIFIKRGNIILLIEDIHFLCNTSGNTGQMDVSTILKPLMENNRLRIVGSTTFEDFRKYMENDTSFCKKFYKVTVDEPTPSETMTILSKISKNYAKYYGVKFSKEVLEEIINLSKKYMFNRHFPEKAIEVIDMLGAFCKYREKAFSTVEDVQETISKMLNVPLTNVSESEEELLKTLEDRLKAEIIGQDEAVKKVSDAFIISRAGLRELNKTASTLFFKGSSGCGKSELCRALSRILHIPLVRFDMSEYMEEHSVSKLIGSPPGYKDSGDGKAGNGLLINAVDENPYCILLLDEIEKAHPKVHNLLLQVMDNGKLTSSMGKSVTFENVFLIMTSNVGSYNSHKINIGFGNSSNSSPSDKDFELSFLPEFRNRIDSVITFNDLSDMVMNKICMKFLNELSQMLGDKQISLTYDNKVVSYIVGKGGNTDGGARPLKHIITNEIKNKIAKNIVLGVCQKKDTINLSVLNNNLTFEVKHGRKKINI